MYAGSTPVIMAFDPFSTDSSAEQHRLGEFTSISDSREFRYALAGASNISGGKVQQAPTPKTNHHNCTAIASVVGTTTPTFTLGATATVASEYNEGFVITNVTPDVGRTYKVSNMGVIASAGTATPTLFEGLITAWTTATRVNLVHNTYANTVESASTTKRPAGVSMVNVTTLNYYWGQTRGPASTLADGTIALGSLIVTSGSVAGGVTAISGTWATALATAAVGQATIMAGVDTEYRPMFLNIP